MQPLMEVEEYSPCTNQSRRWAVVSKADIQLAAELAVGAEYNLADGTFTVVSPPKSPIKTTVEYEGEKWFVTFCANGEYLLKNEPI